MRYEPGLDGLRAVAVLAVLAFHARIPGFEGGFFGVDLFFVLSGYLITRLLADENRGTGTIAIRTFYLRRLRRLYPALILFLVTYLVAAPHFFAGITDHLRDAILAVFYLSDYGRAFWDVPVVIQHTWSLAVEEHFYLLWPLVLPAILKLEGFRRVHALLLLAVIATTWRWFVLGWDGDWTNVYTRFDTRLSGLFLGGAIALWNPPKHSWYFSLGTVLFTSAIVLGGWKEKSSLTWLAIVAEAGAVLMVLGAPGTRLLSTPIIVWIGRLSYGMYLWHYPVMFWMRNQGIDWVSTMLVGTLFAVSASAVSYFTVEAAFRPIRRRQVTTRSETAPSEA
ncbi:acyltransferase family protein [Pseudoxanthomonas beigongshangi]